MAERTFTVELDEEQARILSEIAQAHGTTPQAALIEAIGHGLAMIVAGVNESDLAEPWDHPDAKKGKDYPVPLSGPEIEGDELPF